MHELPALSSGNLTFVVRTGLKRLWEKTGEVRRVSCLLIWAPPSGLRHRSSCFCFGEEASRSGMLLQRCGHTPQGTEATPIWISDQRCISKTSAAFHQVVCNSWSKHYNQTGSPGTHPSHLNVRFSYWRMGSTIRIAVDVAGLSLRFVRFSFFLDIFKQTIACRWPGAWI